MNIIAQAVAAGGYQVLLYDAAADRVPQAQAANAASLARQIARKEAAAELGGRIETATAALRADEMALYGQRKDLDRLEGEERAGFLAAYARLVAAAYPPEPDGSTLFPCRRLFIVARR